MRKFEIAVCVVTLLYAISTIGFLCVAVNIVSLQLQGYLTYLITDTIAILCFMLYIAISLFIYLKKNISLKSNRILKICFIIVVILFAAKLLGSVLFLV